MSPEDLDKIEALSERLDLELAGLSAIADKTSELLADVQALEEAVKEFYK